MNWFEQDSAVYDLVVMVAMDDEGNEGAGVKCDQTVLGIQAISQAILEAESQTFAVVGAVMTMDVVAVRMVLWVVGLQGCSG